MARSKEAAVTDSEAIDVLRRLVELTDGQAVAAAARTSPTTVSVVLTTERLPGRKQVRKRFLRFAELNAQVRRRGELRFVDEADLEEV